MNHYELLIALGIIGLAFLSYKNKLLKDKLNNIEDNCSENENDDLSRSGFLEVKINTFNDGTSVWCRGESNVDRTCKFHHLCYSPLYDDFIFFHGPKSVMSGIPLDRFSPALADLSSVPNHNTQYFNYVDMPLGAIKGFDRIFLLKGDHFVFNRFNPANLMHVFHDDLLPLFHILSEVNYGDVNASEIRFVLLDGHQQLDYFDLYTLFSSQLPLLKNDLKKSGNSVICFEKAMIGLSNATTWYQYGFQEPQGPIRNFGINARTVGLFTDYLKNKMGVEKEEPPHSGLKGILIGRRTNRLIVNEGELLMALARDLRINVQLMYLEDGSVKELIQRISSVNLLIGVHGSALSMSMFLPKGALLVEIFPYAVNPDHYTPYKTLVSIHGLGINYLAWRNMKKENTVFHKGAPAEFGGIDHLSSVEQSKILSSSEVPLHLCCNDPEWLFRIYQDTVVDVQSFITALKNAMTEDQQEINIESSTSQMYPGQVLEVLCKKLQTAENVSLEVVWQPPWNIQHLDNGEGFEYEVWIQEAYVDNTRAWILKTTRYTFDADFAADTTYFVWIRCIINNSVGPFSNVSVC